MTLPAPVGALAAGLALACVLQAAGARVRAVLRLPVAPGLRLPVDLVLGSGAAGACILALGLGGALRPWFLVLLTGLLGVTGRWRGTLAAWRRAWPAAVAGLPFLLVAVQPPFFYDALVYHLGLPWQGLVEGGLKAHPENLFAAFPPLAQLAYVPALSVGLVRVPAVLHWLVFVAAAAAVTALARAAGAPRGLAALAGAAFMLLPTHVLVPGFPAAEAWALAAVLSALALAVAWQDRPGVAWLIGGLLGLAVAARLQGLPWALIVGGVVLATARRRTTSGLRTVAGAVAGSTVWWLKNLVLLGDPVAPLLWHREGMETLWRDSLSSLHAGVTLGRVVGSFPAHLIPAATVVAPLALAAGYAVLARRSRPTLVLAAAAAAGLVAWQVTGALPRFLAPTLALLAALAAAAAVSRGGATIAALALGLTVLLGAAATARLLLGPPGSAMVAGVLGRPGPSLVVDDPAPAFRASRALPEDARVLFVGETRPFGFPRPMVVSSQHDAPPLREVVEGLPDAAAVRGWLRRRGFTHLLVNRGELARLGRDYPVAPWRSAAGRRRFGQLLALLGSPVVRVGEVQVYRLGTP